LSHHVKQKKQFEPPLMEPAVELLRRMQVGTSSPARGPLFVGRDGKQARVSIKRPWIQACKAAGLVEVVVVEGKRGKPLERYKPTVRVHDLRHTFASHCVLNGVPLKVVGELLGHTQIVTTARYANLTQDDLRTAAGKFANVIQMTKRPA
ncbi:MAG: tyrosine-type recombinase/integrase, partial [Silvibacterium sp.]|nr:tyrosine-type recombinase/integrase [Silvibacterium sp.]